MGQGGDETLRTLHRLRLDARTEYETALAAAREELRQAEVTLALDRDRLALLAPQPSRRDTTVTSGTLQRDLVCDAGLSHARTLATRRMKQSLSVVAAARTALESAEERWRDSVAQERVVAAQLERHDRDQRRLALRREDDDNDDLAHRG